MDGCGYVDMGRCIELSFLVALLEPQKCYMSGVSWEIQHL